MMISIIHRKKNDEDLSLLINESKLDFESRYLRKQRNKKIGKTIANHILDVKI